MMYGWGGGSLLEILMTFFFLGNSPPSFSVSALYHNHKCHFFPSSLFLCVCEEGVFVCQSTLVFGRVAVCLD